MINYVVSVGVYCYAKDKVVVESFRVVEDDWKKALILHSEFAGEKNSGGDLGWLSPSLPAAKRQLDNNDLQIDVVFTEISSN